MIHPNLPSILTHPNTNQTATICPQQGESWTDQIRCPPVGEKCQEARDFQEWDFLYHAWAIWDFKLIFSLDFSKLHIVQEFGDFEQLWYLNVWYNIKLNSFVKPFIFQQIWSSLFSSEIFSTLTACHMYGRHFWLCGLIPGPLDALPQSYSNSLPDTIIGDFLN